MSTDDETSRIINKLFKTLVEIAPGFRQAWPTQSEFDGAKRQWMKAFSDSGLNSVEKIAIGVRHFRKSRKAFIPTAGEFIAMCELTAEEMGAPITEIAYREACEKSNPSYGPNKNWSHPCVQWAARQVTSHTLCNYPREKSFPMFKNFYREAVKLFDQGKIMNQLEDNSKITEDEQKKNSIVLPQYEKSRGLSDVFKILGVKK